MGSLGKVMKLMQSLPLVCHEDDKFSIVCWLIQFCVHLCSFMLSLCHLSLDCSMPPRPLGKWLHVFRHNNFRWISWCELTKGQGNAGWICRKVIEQQKMPMLFAFTDCYDIVRFMSWTHTHTHTHSHTRARTHTHTNRQTNRQIQTHTQTQHTHVHIHIHTYT